MNGCFKELFIGFRTDIIISWWHFWFLARDTLTLTSSNTCVHEILHIMTNVHQLCQMSATLTSEYKV